MFLVFLFPQVSFATVCYENNVNQYIALSEFDYNNPESDFIEFYVKKPELVDLSKLELIVDGKNILTEEYELENYNYIAKDLVATTEQIFLIYNGQIIDAVCWSNGNITESEKDDMDLYLSYENEFGECLDSSIGLNKNSSLAKSDITSNKWEISYEPSPGKKNLFSFIEPKVEIVIQSGDTFDYEKVKLNLNSLIENESDLELTYKWLLNGEIFSEKANPDLLEITAVGFSEIELQVLTNLGFVYRDNLSVYVAEKIEEEIDDNDVENEVEESPDLEDQEVADEVEINYFKEFGGLVIESILPNPEGSDTGNEWIQLWNQSEKDLNLNGWFLDDSEGQSTPYEFGDLIIQAGEKYKIFNAESKVNLNNDSDKVRLFTPKMELFDELNYENAGSAEVIGKTKNVVSDENEEINEDNLDSVEKDEIASWDGMEIMITELMPNPEGSDTGNEWIEIFNPNSKSISLDNWIIQINKKEIKLDGIMIEANFYNVVDVSGIANTTASISLISPDETIVQELNYEKSMEGLSYALINNEFEWTRFITKQSENPEKMYKEGVVELVNLDDFEIVVGEESYFLESRLEVDLSLGDKVKLGFIQSDDVKYIVDIEIIDSDLGLAGFISSETVSKKQVNYFVWLQVLASLGLGITGLIFRKPIFEFTKTKLQEI